MNIPENTWMVFMLGGFGGLLYCHFISPVLKKLIYNIKAQWHMRQSAAITDAYCAGYGWAWSSVMIECHSLDWVKGTRNQPYKNTPLEIEFTEGVQAAVEDIEFYQHVAGKEPE